jgi:hypothetical protein
MRSRPVRIIIGHALRRLVALCMGSMIAFLLLSGVALAESHVALVIGNSDYRRVPALDNPRNDARGVSEALRRNGFTVTTAIDADFNTMRRALIDFSRAVYEAQIAIVFFAGHGMEIAGENWVIPVDAALRTDLHPEQEAMSLRTVIASVSGAKKLGLVVLDACRDNPFAGRMQRSTAKSGTLLGLVQVEPTGSVVVAYSAKAGTQAIDGTGVNSPYTTALLAHLEAQDLDIDLLFRKVRDDVVAATNGQQEPFLYGAMSKEPLYLRLRANERVDQKRRQQKSTPVSAPNLPLPSDIPIDPDVLKLVETHPFFASSQADPVRLGSYNMTSNSSFVTNGFKVLSGSENSTVIRWLRSGMMYTETVQRMTSRHTMCPPGACDSTNRSAGILAGNGAISLGYRSASGGKYGSYKSTGKLVRLDKMQGTIFPIAVGNRYSYRATYEVRSPSLDEETSEVDCEYVQSFDARRFHAALTGQAILLSCRTRATYKVVRTSNRTSNSKELYFTDLGAFMSVDAINPKERIVQAYFENQMVQDNVLKDFALSQR